MAYELIRVSELAEMSTPADANVLPIQAGDTLKKITFANLKDAAVGDMEGSLAAAYDSTATYAVGDYCIYEGRLYRCTAAITTAEAWTAGHWTAAVLTDDIASDLSAEASTRSTNDNALAADITEALGDLAAAYSSSATYAVGDYCTKDGQLYRCTTAITTAEAWTAAHWSAVALGDDTSDLRSALNQCILYKYIDYVQGTITSGGANQSNSNYVRTGYIDINADFLKYVKPTGYAGYICYYTGTEDGFITRASVGRTNALSYDTSYLKTQQPTAKYVRFVISKYSGSDPAPTTPSDIINDNNFVVTLATKDVKGKLAALTTAINTEKTRIDAIYNQFFDISGDFTEDYSFTVNYGSEKYKNMIISLRSWYEGSDAPYISIIRSSKNMSGVWSPYLVNKYFEISDKTNACLKQWRVAPWYDNVRDYLTVTINIPAGTTLHIIKLSNAYDDSISRVDCGINLNAHGYCGCGGPSNTMFNFAMAAKLGFKYCITIPKVTHDGEYICLHDDTLNSAIRQEDGSQLPAEYLDVNVNTLDYSDLLQFSAGAVRGLPYVKEKIPKLEDFFKLCAETGMHPMLSIHPSLDGHWSNIKALAKKYNVLSTLNIKGDTANILAPMQTLLNDIESYTLDTATSNISSKMDTFRQYISTYGITVKTCVEVNSTIATESNINAILAAGFKAGVYNLDSDSNIKNYVRLGITEFTTDNTASVGLNW